MTTPPFETLTIDSSARAEKVTDVRVALGGGSSSAGGSGRAGAGARTGSSTTPSKDSGSVISADGGGSGRLGEAGEVLTRGAWGARADGAARLDVTAAAAARGFAACAARFISRGARSPVRWGVCCGGRCDVRVSAPSSASGASRRTRRSSSTNEAMAACSFDIAQTS